MEDKNYNPHGFKPLTHLGGGNTGVTTPNCSVSQIAFADWLLQHFYMQEIPKQNIKEGEIDIKWRSATNGALLTSKEANDMYNLKMPK